MLFLPYTVLLVKGYIFEGVIYYSKKLEEQIFDSRFFNLVRILGIWVLPDETSRSHTWFLTKQEHLFHLATPKISSILNRLKNRTSNVCSFNPFE